MEIQIKKQMDSREENKEMEAVKRTGGLVHIYCGNGKGKTTASVGAAVRAAGNGKKVLIKRFLKNDHSGEVEALKQIPGITVLPCTRQFGFSWKMKQEEKEEAKEYYGKELEKAWVNRGIEPISFKYSRMGSVLATPSNNCSWVAFFPSSSSAEEDVNSSLSPSSKESL